MDDRTPLPRGVLLVLGLDVHWVHHLDAHAEGIVMWFERGLPLKTGEKRDFVLTSREVTEAVGQFIAQREGFVGDFDCGVKYIFADGRLLRAEIFISARDLEPPR